MSRKIGIAAVVVSLLVLTATSVFAQATIDPASKPGTHWITEPVCTYNADHTTITCTSGTAAGLGSTALTFVAYTEGGCKTSGNGNQPGGHIQSGAKTLTPRGGKVKTPVVTLTATCPAGLIQFLGPVVTYELTRDGEIIFKSYVTAT